MSANRIRDVNVRPRRPVFSSGGGGAAAFALFGLLSFLGSGIAMMMKLVGALGESVPQLLFDYINDP